MGFTREAIRGISWVSAIRVSARAFAFLRTIVLARILTPSQFGVFGIAVIVLGLIDIITETGINVFLVQEEKFDKYINTAWVVSIARGVIIALIIIFSAPFISSFFNSPDALSMLLLISFVPLIKGFINPSIVRFQKDLTFGKEFWFRLPIFAVEFGVALILALITRDASSLVFGFIAGAILEVVLSFAVVRPLPVVSFNFGYFGQILHRGKWVTAYSAFAYGFQNGDNIVVGRILGTFQLGLYRIGYQIATIPQEVVDSVSRVAFPIYVRIGGDKQRLKKAFLKTFAACAIFASIFGLVLFFFTQQLVLIFLGESWLPVVPALRVLAILGMVRAFSNVTFPLFLSVKKQQYITIVTLVSLAGLLVTIIPFITRFDLVGAALASIAGSILSIPFIVYFVVRILR